MRLGLVAFLFSFTWSKNIEPLNTLTLWFQCRPFLLPCVLSFCEEPHCCSVPLGAGLGCTHCSREVSGVRCSEWPAKHLCVCALVVLKRGLKFPYVTWAYVLFPLPSTAQGCQVQLTHSAPTWIYASNKHLLTVCPDPLPAVPSLGRGEGGHVLLVVAHANFVVHWGLASRDPSRGEHFNHGLQPPRLW